MANSIDIDLGNNKSVLRENETPRIKVPLEYRLGFLQDVFHFKKFYNK